MRSVNSRSLVELVNEECRIEPVLFSPEVNLLLKEISTLPELNVSNFDRDTRYQMEKDRESMPVRDLCIVYARRFIAAIAFDKLVPASVPYARKDAAFAFEKAAGANHSMLKHFEVKDRIPLDIRIMLNRLRAIKIFNELYDTRNAYYSCVYMLSSALSAEKASRLYEGELPTNWTPDKLKEYVKSTSDMAWKLREESKASGKIIGLHNALNSEISGLLN